MLKDKIDIYDEKVFLTLTEYELAEDLINEDYDRFGGYSYNGEKLLLGCPEINLERIALYWYFRLNGGEILDGDDEDSYLPMVDPPADLIIITNFIKWRSRIWQKAMMPFLLSEGVNTSIYQHRVTVDRWENLEKYAFEKECFFIFDDYTILGDENLDFESMADSFFTIIDNGQQNTWILTDWSRTKCGVFPALSGPNEII